MTQDNSLVLQELKQLNEDIGNKERIGEVAFFDALLEDKFLFRRANGEIVDKQEYIGGLASVKENPYEHLDTSVGNITIDGDSAVVDVNVVAKRKNMPSAGEFRNIRVFEFKSEAQAWVLVMWVNTKVEDL